MVAAVSDNPLDNSLDNLIDNPSAMSLLLFSRPYSFTKLRINEYNTKRKITFLFPLEYKT